MNLFGDESYQAAKDELEKNILGRGCIDKLLTYHITWDIRKQALGYLMFLKRKQSGKMKGRGCANRHPQQEYITKYESSSPTVSLLYVFMGLYVMDTMEGRKVIIVDIPGAFLQGDWPQDKHPGYIMIEGIMVDIICEINPLFHDMVIWSKDGKKKFLYS